MEIFLLIVVVLVALVIIGKLKGNLNIEKLEADAINKITESDKPIDFEQVAKAKAVANYSLGEMYNTGESVPKDYKKAAKFYRLASDQGFAQAQNRLGEMYMYGHGVPQDYKETVKWLKLAAEQGHANAQLNLGVMYHNGQGVPGDLVQAYMWQTIAIENSDEGQQKINFKNMRGFVEEKMTADQIVEAQELARKRIANNFKEH